MERRGSIDALSGIEVVDLTGGDGADVMNAKNFTGKVTLHGGGGNDHLHGGIELTSFTVRTVTTTSVAPRATTSSTAGPGTIISMERGAMISSTATTETMRSGPVPART